MAHRIEVGFKPEIRDSLGEMIKKRIIEDLLINVDSVKTIDAYTIDADLSVKQLKTLAENLFADQIIQNYSIDKSLAKEFDWLIEVAFKPGVTDNVGKTSSEAIEDILKIKPNAYTSRQYLISGRLDKEQVEKITSDLLANQLIERWKIWSNEKRDDITLPIVKLKHEPQVIEFNLDIDDGELLKISRERVLALNLDEMKAIRDYYKKPEILKERNGLGLKDRPTDVEIEASAQTWSEHCKHKIFNAIIHYEENGKITKIKSLFNTYIKKATTAIAKKMERENNNFLVSVFKDNAGVIKFNDKWNLVMKVETHNSPSALDPYGGAITGIVGVNRDPSGTGMGAKLIFNTDVFCFASPFFDKELPPRLMHPKRIFEGVRKGVEHGGNKSGIPTVNGSIVFDERYLGKPLIYCGTAGIMSSKINNKLSHIKNIENGDLAVMCGGRIGKDGIHGATFSSEELHEGSPATAVQIGDPITQKKMLDFLLEARDLGLYETLTDNGAGGLSSSIGELAIISNGCEIYLEACPLKYQGLDPWEILLSEAQERMTVVVKPEKLDQFLSLSKRRGVESTVVGKFTDTGMFRIFYNNKTVGYLDLEFFHNGLPQMELKAIWNAPKHEEPDFKCPENLTNVLKEMLSRLNICSKECVVRQYDHEVQAGSVIKPLTGKHNDGPSDGAIIKPILNSSEGVVVAHGICPRYSDIDTYHMAACAIDEAIRNAIAVGGSLKHLAGLDNFCWCDPIKSEKNTDGEYKLAQLVRANQALYDYTTIFDVPCISGKDSMKNDYQIGNTKISIPPTILFSVIGKIDDVEKAVTMDVKKPYDSVYVLGLTKAELGGSEYFAMHNSIGNSAPKVDGLKAMKLYNALTKANENRLVESCHDCSDGGLGVALAESSFSGGFGIEADLTKVPKESIDRDDFILFSESQSRFVVTVKPENKQKFEDIMNGNIFACIGMVRNDKEFIVKGLNGNIVVNTKIDELKEAWQKTLRW